MIDKGTITEKFRDQILEMGYYQAPITDLNGFEHGKQTCLKCNQERHFFTLNPEDNANIEWICIECIKNNNFDFFQDTELGFVTVHDVPLELAKGKISDDAYKKLLKTPNFFTIQGLSWKVHCNDFMIYRGTWEAWDFTEASLDGNGKKLFLEMIEEEYIKDWWEEFELKDNERENTWIDALCHVFECPHCQVKRGYWEF